MNELDHSTSVAFTRHASVRLAQRGIPERIAALVLDHGDVVLHAGNGCETVGLSRAAAEMLISSGVSPDDAARASRLRLIIADGMRAVTVLRENGRQGRFYRKQGRTRSLSRERV